MAANYLQYIGSVRQDRIPLSHERFLVSGADAKVRSIVARDIVSAAYARGKALFIVDNTQSCNIPQTSFGRYRVVNVLDGTVNLCDDLLNVDSPAHISRLSALLSCFGFDTAKTMKIVTYLQFVKETQRRLGQSTDLTIDVLDQYAGVMLVEQKLSQLVERGELSEDNFRYLNGVYSSVSAAAADFGAFLVLVRPFSSGNVRPTAGTALHLPFGAFALDGTMQQLLSKLLIFYVKENSGNTTVLILDDGNGERKFVIDILANLPVGTEVHMLSNDAFTFREADKNVLMNVFSARIYSRHDNMASCGEIETLCGQIDVVKYSSTVSVDRRLRNSFSLDGLFGTNRTETMIANAPSKESRFRKEMINTLPDATGILDYAGNKMLFSF